jgi:chromosome segregation ATPase
MVHTVHNRQTRFMSTPRSLPTSPRIATHDIYLTRSQFNAIKTARETITTEDIVNLKREKQNLIRERTLLKAKLARYASYNQHPKPYGRNQQIANSLEREVHKLEQLTAAKRAEIAQLIYSDRAAIVTELQEESKMLHLELLRLKRVKQETETELKNAAVQLEEASHKYSSAALAAQQKVIKQLEKEVAEQRRKNQVAEEKVVKLKDEQEGVGKELEKGQQRLEELRIQIRAEQQEIAALDQQMARMKADHAVEMQRLQAQV